MHLHWYSVLHRCRSWSSLFKLCFTLQSCLGTYKTRFLTTKVSQKTCFRWMQMRSAACGHAGCSARLKLVQGGNQVCGWCANHELSTRCCTPHLSPYCQTPLVKAPMTLMHQKLTIESAVLWMRQMWQQDYMWAVRELKQSFSIW